MLQYHLRNELAVRNLAAQVNSNCTRDCYRVYTSYGYDGESNLDVCIVFLGFKYCRRSPVLILPCLLSMATVRQCMAKKAGERALLRSDGNVGTELTQHYVPALSQLFA